MYLCVKVRRSLYLKIRKLKTQNEIIGMYFIGNSVVFCFVIFLRCKETICQNAPAFERLKHLITSMCINSYIGFKFDRCNHDNRILLQY